MWTEICAAIYSATCDKCGKHGKGWFFVKNMSHDIGTRCTDRKCAPKRETFKQARRRLWDGILASGWPCQWSSALLKHPWIEGADGSRVWFKAQAIYFTDPGGRFGDARSLYSDMRGITVDRVIWGVSK